MLDLLLEKIKRQEEKVGCNDNQAGDESFERLMGEIEHRTAKSQVHARIFGYAAIIMGLFIMYALISGCAGGPLTKREIGAGIGALGGAAAGGIIGSAVGHPGAGAAIGGALGLGAGALIGDQLQEQENQQNELDQRIQEQERELERLRREKERLQR